MTKLREMKTLMLCIFCVAVSSFIALFYYTINYGRYMKAARTHVDLLRNDTQWNRQLQGRPFPVSTEKRWKNGLTYNSSAEPVERKRDQREQNIYQLRSHTSLPNYNLVTKNRRNRILGLCPEKSPTLGKLSIFDYIMSPCLGVRKNLAVAVLHATYPLQSGV